VHQFVGELNVWTILDCEFEVLRVGLFWVLGKLLARWWWERKERVWKLRDAERRLRGPDSGPDYGHGGG